jgi:hypothetical protein
MFERPPVAKYYMPIRIALIRGGDPQDFTRFDDG